MGSDLWIRDSSLPTKVYHGLFPFYKCEAATSAAFPPSSYLLFFHALSFHAIFSSCIPDIHTLKYIMTTIFIGKLIKDELKAQQKSVVWLSQELGCNRTNIYKIFNRHSIDAELLLRISRIMGRNFFEPYVERLSS